MKKFILAALAISFATMLTLSTESCKKTTTASGPTLYDTLGGTAKVSDPAAPSTQIEAGRLAVRSVVDSALYVIASDTAINGYFTVLLTELGAHNTSGFVALQNNLTDFFCVGAGAKNFTYAGKSMTAAHDPAQNSRINQKVATDDFNKFTGDVVLAAQQNHVPAGIIGSLGKVIVSQESQVVQR